MILFVTFLEKKSGQNEYSSLFIKALDSSFSSHLTVTFRTVGLKWPNVT